MYQGGSQAGPNAGAGAGAGPDNQGAGATQGGDAPDVEYEEVKDKK
jgi:hypothetical protein